LKPNQRATFAAKKRPLYPTVPKPAYKSEQNRTEGHQINLERQRRPYANAYTSAGPPSHFAEGSTPIPRTFDAGIPSAHRATPTADRPLGAEPESSVPRGESSRKRHVTRQPQGTGARSSPEDARTVPLTSSRQQVPTTGSVNEGRTNDQDPALHLPHSVSSTSSETPKTRWQPASVSEPIDEDQRITDPIDEDPKDSDPKDQDVKATELIDEDPRTDGLSNEWPGGQAEQQPSYGLGDPSYAPARFSPPTLVHLAMLDHECRPAYMRQYMAAWNQQNAYLLFDLSDKRPQDAPGVMQHWQNSWAKHGTDLKRLIDAGRVSASHS